MVNSSVGVPKLERNDHTRFRVNQHMFLAGLQNILGAQLLIIIFACVCGLHTRIAAQIARLKLILRN